MSDLITASHFLSTIAEAVATGRDDLDMPWFVADVSFTANGDSAYVITLRHDDGTVQRFLITALEILPRTTAGGGDV